MMQLLIRLYITIMNRSFIKFSNNRLYFIDISMSNACEIHGVVNPPQRSNPPPQLPLPASLSMEALTSQAQKHGGTPLSLDGL